MSGYVYQEYPKCLYQRDGTTLVVENQEEEESASSMGWLTAQQYHNPVVSTPLPSDSEPAAPEGEDGFKPEDESDGAL